MTSPFRPFRRSVLFTQCEECRRTVDLSSVGVCERCRRVLCHQHLHGGLFRRLKVDLGATPVCLKCRAEQAGR